MTTISASIAPTTRAALRRWTKHQKSRDPKWKLSDTVRLALEQFLSRQKEKTSK